MTGKWIWTENKSDIDVYGEFKTEFYYVGGKLKLEISADSEYAIFINDKFVYSGQYADFPWYKIYDEIDISTFANVGENTLTVWAWHCGDYNSCHYIHRAGVRFVIGEDGVRKASSSAATRSRTLPYFVSGNKKLITPQMGLSFRVDGRAIPAEFANSIELADMPQTLYPRPIDRLEILEKRMAKRISDRVYDLGEETVGLPFIDLCASCGEEITVSFGERLTQEGNVPRLIGVRDFSYTVIGNGERMRVFNPLRKLGLRYLEVSGECAVNEIGVIPLQYPFKEIKRKFADERRQRIYDVAVKTLKLNAFEHYFDCPWREQAFYALDGRFQMRYGYKAFASSEYQRAALRLMSEDRNSTGHISLVVPATCSLVIPSFSLFYVIAMEEYASQTGDNSLIEKYFDKIVQLVSIFRENEKDGLVQNFTNGDFWNFYEWNDGLDGQDKNKEDCVLNLNYVLGLKSFVKICKMLGREYECYEREIELHNDKINAKYYDRASGLYKVTEKSENFTELCNAYAVLAGAASGEVAKKICHTLADENSGLAECTLSMLSFKYDALLKVDKERYSAYILKDIDKKYSYMLSQGATSFWETMKGWRDFDDAGSLCHGWSALPVYYYSILEQTATEG